MIVAYDGTEFRGWQKQPGQRTVQDQIEQAVRRVARHQVVIIGAGRTDAGVHARGQVANFYTIRDIAVEKLSHAIGSRLPKDIHIDHMREVPLDFHSSRSAIRKLYRYRVFAAARRPVCAHAQHHTYHFWHLLDVDRMTAAARAFLGEHDFSAMASRGSPRLSNVRTVTRCDVFHAGQEIRFDIEGTGFLYNQVRNMVGTLLEIGRGHWDVSRLAEILAGGDRTQAGPTAPARGLSLQWVLYDLPSLYITAEGKSKSAGSERDGEAPTREGEAPAEPRGDEPIMPPGISLEEEPSG